MNTDHEPETKMVEWTNVRLIKTVILCHLPWLALAAFLLVWYYVFSPELPLRVFKYECIILGIELVLTSIAFRFLARYSTLRATYFICITALPFIICGGWCCMYLPAFA